MTPARRASVFAHGVMAGLLSLSAPAFAEAVDPVSRPTSPDFSEQLETHKSYAIPAVELVSFDLLLNLFDRHVEGHDYDSNLKSIRHNLGASWRTDSDPFLINQVGHPYQGATYHGIARSAGLNYWEAAGYTFLGSAFWEVAGETTPPSRNDQITTGIGGSFLGEELYRMANLVLAHDDIPRVWRELGAALISPPTGFNRLAFGDRFDAVFDSHNPAYYSRLQIGFSGVTQNSAGRSTVKLARGAALTDFSLEYGLPGKPGYHYTRPFDYFNFQATLSSANGFENLMTRGLLIGTEYASGDNFRGIWGLYGSYDYLAPQTYRVASTAASFGTTGQWWLSPTVALQGTALLGVGYAAVGTARSTDVTDNNFGVAPQTVLAMRMIFGHAAALDLSAREYYVSNVDNPGVSKDNIARVEASITVPIHGRHAISLRYLGNRRDATYRTAGDLTQTRSTVGIFYTYLGHEGFGAVDWRGQ
jgi:hypothetical protein